ncbi:MAG TPA: tRNA (guanosine(37)-N1)-methyltransferase TrmD, partial [Dehalococcoidia bacterium]|nr:tRNA (guanosine(37)-N1)-methyltransferase TrmD [Dehalococcoidia bacterium]
MRIDILTLFPGMFRGPFDESILKRAIEAGLVQIHVHDIRQWAEGKHSVADDYPYGGGPGMVMKPEPVFAATEAVLGLAPERGPIVLMTPVGRRFSHNVALELAREQRLVIICGHYEGVDQRVHEHLATDEISIGDYVLSGGEIPAMVVVDAVVRQLPGALGCAESAEQESFADSLLESPHYTRPPDFRGWAVPDVLLSGHHAEVAKWRRRHSLLLTAQRRPDLLAGVHISNEEREWLAEQGVE